LHARRAALEAVARTLMEREVIDGVELKALIDANEPGLKLVPGSVAVAVRPAEPNEVGGAQAPTVTSAPPAS
jgi:hypothetical protein